ncbi:MAG: hypothetical protein R3Y64_08630 [Peptostreptococcaceae bacterium]
MKRNQIEFKRGTILSKNMLEIMYSYPKEIIDVLYSNNENGIISGLDLIKKDNNIILNKGIIKHNNEIFIMNEDILLNDYFLDLVENNQYVMHFNLNEIKNIDDNILEEVLNFEIVEFDKYQSNNNLYIGTFRFNSLENISFAPTINDLLDSNSYFNNIDAIYSKNTSSTFMPSISKLILNKIINKDNKNPLDITLISEISNNTTLCIDTISYYISSVLNKSINDLNKKNILNLLIQAIDEPYVQNIIHSKKETIIDEPKIILRSGLL